MSALPSSPTPHATAGAPGRPTRPRLGLVPTPHATIGRIPFALVLGGLLVAGLVGLLFLNTALQNQAIEAHDLRTRAVALGYREGELRQQVIEASSTGELTRKASKLGLRPNDNIAFVDLRTGEITGTTEPASGEDRPSSVVLTQEEESASQADQAAEYASTRTADARAAAEAARERVLAQNPALAPTVPGPTTGPGNGPATGPVPPPAFPGAPAPAPQQPAPQQPVPNQDTAPQNPAAPPGAPQNERMSPEQQAVEAPREQALPPAPVTTGGGQ